jgi:uncharacterized protein DUF6677
MRRHPVLTLILAWLLPGAGHFYIGQRRKGVVFCFLVLALFFTGVLITEGGGIDCKPLGVIKVVLRIDRAADCGRHPWSFALQAFDGPVAFVALAATSGASEIQASKLSDLGLLLTLVAGALNVLLIADALYRAGPQVAEDENG